MVSYAGTVNVGQEFTVLVRVKANYVSPVDTAQVYLEFNPEMLEVVSLKPNPRLEVLLQSRFDNAEGEVDYAAGTLGYAVQYPFTLCTLTFRARAATSLWNTAWVDFSRLRAPRETKSISRGRNITGELIPLRVVVR